MRIDIEREIELSAVRATMADKMRAAASVLSHAVWNVFWAAVLLGGLFFCCEIWRDALNPPMVISEAIPEFAPTTTTDGSSPVWMVEGIRRTAHHITTSAPGYYGPGMTVSGWDANDNVIWVMMGVSKLERVR